LSNNPLAVAIFTDNDLDRRNSVTASLKQVLRLAPADLRPRVFTAGEIAVLGTDTDAAFSTRPGP
jgi:hypothetical protein